MEYGMDSKRNRRETEANKSELRPRRRGSMHGNGNGW